MTVTVKSKSKSTATPDGQNIYLKMPLDRVRADAIHGVRLARQAWRILDPDGANLALGRIVEPTTKKSHEFRQGPSGER